LFTLAAGTISEEEERAPLLDLKEDEVSCPSSDVCPLKKKKKKKKKNSKAKERRSSLRITCDLLEISQPWKTFGATSTTCESRRAWKATVEIFFFFSLFFFFVSHADVLPGNYHVFKNGIKPMWEDPQNNKGGKWILLLKGSQKDKLNE
jgi:hypothetical protein